MYASPFTFLFLVFARSIEESWEQCVASKTYLETTELYAFLGFIDILEVNKDVDKAILNCFSTLIFYFTPSFLQWAQVFPPPFLGYSGDTDGGTSLQLRCQVTSVRILCYKLD